MLLGIILDGDIYWLAFIVYFLCHIGILFVQSTNYTGKFSVHNNKVAPRSSLTCIDRDYINSVDMYGFNTTFFDVDPGDVARIQDACSCKHTCDIPFLTTRRNSSWDLYVHFQCLGSCIEDTTLSTVSQTNATTVEDSGNDAIKIVILTVCGVILVAGVIVVVCVLKRCGVTERTFGLNFGFLDKDR